METTEQHTPAGTAEGDSLPAATSDAAPAPAPRARRRTPKLDELLAGAVDTARAALEAEAEEGQVGEHLGVVADDDGLVTHRFVAHLSGYAGWAWYCTLARAPRSKHVTVCESGLQAHEGALIAPPWVPYAERVSEEERERIAAVAEGRVPGEH